MENNPQQNSQPPTPPTNLQPVKVGSSKKRIVMLFLLLPFVAVLMLVLLNLIGNIIGLGKICYFKIGGACFDPHPILSLAFNLIAFLIGTGFLAFVIILTLKILKAQPPTHSKLLRICILFYALIQICLYALFSFTSGGEALSHIMHLRYSPNNLPTVTISPIIELKPSIDKSSTANWKTYTNSQFGYSFSYPLGWNIQGIPENNATNILDTQYLSDVMPIDIAHYKISVVVDNTLLDQLKRFLNYGDAGLQNTAEISTDTIAGKQATKAIVTASEMNPKTGKYTETGKFYKVLLPLKANTLVISGSIDQQPVIDHLLSTFKFTDQASVDTTGWKTFSSLHCSLQYPSTWKTDDQNSQVYDPNMMINKVNNGGGTYPIPSQYVGINVINSTDTPTQYIDKRVQEPQYTGIQVERKPITINGIQGLVIPREGEGQMGYDAIVSNGKELVIINIPTDNPIQNSLINQILSTFKFTQ